MLVVIGIIVVMGALAIPAFQALSPAQKLSTAGSRVVALAESARMNAMSRQANTMLAVITNLPNTTDVSFRTFAVLETQTVNVTVGNTTTTTNEWRQISKWEVLPTGIVLNNNATRSFFKPGSTPLNPAAPNASTSFQYKGTPLANDQYGFVIFARNGSLYNSATNAPTMELVVGVSSANGITRTGPTNNWYQLVFNEAIGRVKTVRP
jgi:Tfp pilus assembly major pilin PilA